MPASYSANNALCVYSALTPGTLTLTTPTPLAAVSVLNAGGGGASTINYTIYHQGGGTESGTIDILDWFNTTATTVAISLRAVSTPTTASSAIPTAPAPDCSTMTSSLPTW